MHMIRKLNEYRMLFLIKELHHEFLDKVEIFNFYDRRHKKRPPNC